MPDHDVVPKQGWSKDLRSHTNRALGVAGCTTSAAAVPVRCTRLACAELLVGVVIEVCDRRTLRRNRDAISEVPMQARPAGFGADAPPSPLR